MRHFHRDTILLICTVIAFSALTGVLFAQEKTAPAILAVVATLVAMLCLLREIRKLIRMMSSFVSAMEMNETSFRIEGDEMDSELKEMASGMNRIASLYIADRRELETRKLYYDRILRVMTHEMRNSIAPVTALSADISEHPEAYSEAEMREALGVIRKSSEGISRFLESYHRLTHLPAPEKIKIEAKDFFAQVSRAADVFVETFGFKYSIIRYELAEGLHFEADPSLFTQVMVNLLKNSLEALSQFRDSRQGDPLWTPDILVRATHSEEGTTITIEDNGPGMSSQMLADPFQPFVTTKSGGSGIGLFISRQIVRLHGGELHLSDLGGRGLRADITIP